MIQSAPHPAQPNDTARRPDRRTEIVLAVSAALAHPNSAPVELNAVLERCGFSKEEILCVFDSIDELIVAIAEHNALLVSQPLMQRVPLHAVDDVCETLVAFGRIAWNEYSTTLVGFIRLMMIEGARNPALKKRVHEAGQSLVTLNLRKFLSAANERKILSISDAQLCAEQLLGLLREPLYQALMLSPATHGEGVATDPVRASVERFIHGCASAGSARR